jgi:hypothetical protein
MIGNGKKNAVPLLTACQAGLPQIDVVGDDILPRVIAVVERGKGKSRRT